MTKTLTLYTNSYMASPTIPKSPNETLIPPKLQV